MTVPRSAAANEILRRRSIRNSLAEWARYKGFEPAPHHHVIIRELEALVFGNELDVLLFHAPPGSAKSTFISVLFPSWYLANFPKNNILLATHSDEFAQRWGRRVRNDIVSEGMVLGINMSPSNAASDRWALQEGGEYYGVGAGTGISGFRADLGICDDLFGTREDAWSEVVRQKRWDWYVDDFGHRTKPNAKRVLMNTRWHEEDVAGRVIEQINRGLVRGKVINFPAEAEPNDILGRKVGEYLWDEPDGYNYGAFLRQRRAESPPMTWAAMFQQRPAPEDGEYFKAAWLKPYIKAPDKEQLAIYGASDYAVTALRVACDAEAAESGTRWQLLLNGTPFTDRPESDHGRLDEPFLRVATVRRAALQCGRPRRPCRHACRPRGRALPELGEFHAGAGARIPRLGCLAQSGRTRLVPVRA